MFYVYRGWTSQQCWHCCRHSLLMVLPGCIEQRHLMSSLSRIPAQTLIIYRARPKPNWSSHLGIHKQTNACWSIPISQTVFYHFKICRKWELWRLCFGQLLPASINPARILTNKQGKVTITISSGSDFQLLLAALQKNTPGSVLLGLKHMPCIVLLS